MLRIRSSHSKLLAQVLIVLLAGQSTIVGTLKLYRRHEYPVRQCAWQMLVEKENAASDSIAWVVTQEGLLLKYLLYSSDLQLQNWIKGQSSLILPRAQYAPT